MYLIKWHSRYTDACGQFGPMDRELAERIVNLNNQLFPDIDHWIEVFANPRQSAAGMQ